MGHEVVHDRRSLGTEGEQAAQAYLARRGMEVLERNWRCAEGEIDLVLRDGATAVVCEVKTRRSSAFGSPQEAVTRAKLARLRRLAGCWLSAQDEHFEAVRIDVVALLRHPDGTFGLTHLQGVGQ